LRLAHPGDLQFDQVHLLAAAVFAEQDEPAMAGAATSPALTTNPA
jgi:hypothetical protein